MHKILRLGPIGCDDCISSLKYEGHNDNFGWFDSHTFLQISAQQKQSVRIMYFSTVAKCPMVPNSICKVIRKVNFCQFDCDSGYSSMNSSMEREYTCDSNGDWQPHTPQCAQTDPKVAARGTTTTGVGSQSKSSSCRPISTFILLTGRLKNAFISLLFFIILLYLKRIDKVLQSFLESSGT